MSILTVSLIALLIIQTCSVIIYIYLRRKIMLLIKEVNASSESEGIFFYWNDDEIKEMSKFIKMFNPSIKWPL